MLPIFTWFLLWLPNFYFVYVLVAICFTYISMWLPISYYNLNIIACKIDHDTKCVATSFLTNN
jgi:hypothetical protein